MPLVRTDPDEDRHRTFETLAVAHVMGGLSEPEGRVFRSHLLECAQCRARVGELRQLDHDLTDVERAERRVRAAQALETKTSEAEEEEPPPPPQPASRVPRLVVVGGLVLLIVLAGWNYLARGTVREQAEFIERLSEANALLIEGESAAFSSQSGELGAPTQVRFDNENVLLVLDGVDAGTLLYAYQLDADGAVVGTPEPLRGEGERLVRLLSRAEGAVQVEVTRPEEGQRLGVEVVGESVLRSDLRPPRN